MLKKTFVFLLFTAMAVTCFAGVPKEISYQGKLTNSSGAPLEGAYDITFKIYDVLTNGVALWEENHADEQISKGLVSLAIGSVKDLNLDFSKDYYLEIVVGKKQADNTIAKEVLHPRQKISSSAYALRAEKANQADTANTAIAVEARTSDPSSLAPGQIWLRTDL